MESECEEPAEGPVPEQLGLGRPGDELPQRPEPTLDEVLVMERVISLISDMKAVSDRTVRGIQVFRALQQAPRYFLRRDRDRLHALSHAVHQLDEFWSHSWKAKAWLKYIDMLYLHNGPPALVTGMLSALLGGALFWAGIFPAWEDGTEFSCKWCTLCGVGAHYLTLVMWQRRQVAFLDIAGINQRDMKLKMEGILSIGAILKHSRSMVVLWDETYMRGFGDYLHVVATEWMLLLAMAAFVAK
eukprot:s8013_g1.t1